MLRRDCVGEGEHHAWKPTPKIAPKPKPSGQNDTRRTQDLPLLTPLMRTLSPQLIERIRNEFPGWDVYYLQELFNTWIDEDTSRAPKNYEAAFFGWVRQHHAQNRSQVS